MTFEPNEETVLKNVVILGRAAPEELSDGRQTVCTGAWSPERGFIRIYPCDPNSDLFSRWDIINVAVERSDRDTRYESWKIKGRKQNQEERVEVVGEYSRDDRPTLLYNLEDDCIRDINEQKRSLGIIRPEEIHGLEYHEWDTDDHVQLSLFEDDRPQNREDFEYKIKLKFTCPECKTKQGYHNCSLLEWGGYLGMSKTDTSSTKGLENLYDLHDDDYTHWVFVGNMYRERTQFIVINLIWLKHTGGFISTLSPHAKVGEDFDDYKREMLSE
jgi:hypothetical protein